VTTVTPIDANVVGVDPHRQTLTATVLDGRGAAVGHEHFPTTRAGFAQLLGWASAFGAIDRWGVEGASGLGRRLSEFLIEAGHDVRDVAPHRTSQRGRGRHQGKSDLLDSHRIAAETQANPQLPHPFKRAEPAHQDPVHARMALWHNARRSLCKVRVQLMGEIDALVQDLPDDLRVRITAAKTIRARINAFSSLEIGDVDEVVRLRLDLLEHRVAMLRDVLNQDKLATAELTKLTVAARSTLTDIVGIASRAAAELLVEAGDVRRFTEAGFARFNGTAPVPASSGEGAGDPVRHRLSRGGNRRVNAVLYRIAMIQLRCEPRARQLYDNARQAGHTRREAMRVLKRHLSNVVYRTMLKDALGPSTLT
jgi:transposase